MYQGLSLHCTISHKWQLPVISRVACRNVLVWCCGQYLQKRFYPEAIRLFVIWDIEDLADHWTRYREIVHGSLGHQAGARNTLAHTPWNHLNIDFKERVRLFQTIQSSVSLRPWTIIPNESHEGQKARRGSGTITPVPFITPLIGCILT